MPWDVGSGLEGRGVIVTGAAGGIGRAVAIAFARAGARVAALDLTRERVDQVVSQLEGDGHIGVAVDLTDVTGHNLLIQQVGRQLGDLYVLANLAAILYRRADLADVSEEDFDAQIDINLRAAFFLCRAAGAAMIEKGRGGRIITFTSQAWWTGGFGGSVIYAASKGAVTTMTRGLARTLGPHGITVNAVSPGLIETAMLTTGLSAEVYESMRQQTSLGYVGQPEDVAGPVVFLASDHARYITGATLNVSGGFLMY